MGSFFSATLLGIYKEMLTAMELPAVFILLGMALFAFMPANLAFVKNLKARGLIALLNIASLCTLSMHFYIPVLLWILSFFLAAKGRRRAPKPAKSPEKLLYPTPQETRVLQKRHNY